MRQGPPTRPAAEPRAAATGTKRLQATYTLQPKSATGCPAVFLIHRAFVTTGASGTCDIATLDPSVLLGGTCKKQDR